MYIGGVIPYNKKGIYLIVASQMHFLIWNWHLINHRCDKQMPFNYLNNKINIVMNNRVIIKYKHFSFCFINTTTFPFKRKGKASDINQIYPIYNYTIRAINVLTGTLFYVILNTDEGNFIK